MKVQVVSDERGRIISLSVPGDISGVSGIAKAGILPKAGQQVQTLEVPAALEKRPLADLHGALRVDGVGAHARLVPVEHFVEPFLKNS